MRRLLLLAAVILASLTVSPPAHAAASSCSTHHLAVTAWSVQLDFANTSWDFKCGGSNRESWIIFLYFQWQDSNRHWHTFACDNGLPCEVTRPLNHTFAGGSEHGGGSLWNIAGQIDCRTVRHHALVNFLGGSPQLRFNSPTYHIGGC